MTFKTEQENFWAGEFGTEYIQRNQGNALIASNLNLFSKALRCTRGISSCIEFGANIGLNLIALQQLIPGIEAHAIEINTDAAKKLGEVIIPNRVYNKSILDFTADRKWDLTLIKGVLIHTNPEELSQVYEKLVASTGQYLMVVEYYNPAPVSVTYRGHAERLFKRDFAGEIMDQYTQMKLLDYGFLYHRDHNFPADDITWFVLKKCS
jgi:pseudaminic acid biosynthesis-associated methylase